MTVGGIRITRRWGLIASAGAIAFFALAVAAIAVMAEDERHLTKTPDALGQVTISPVGRATTPAPLTGDEQSRATDAIAAAVEARRLPKQFTTEIQGTYEELGVRLLVVTLAFERPATSDGPWLTRICSGTRLSEASLSVAGFTYLSVVVDLKTGDMLQIVPDDPVAVKALESRRNVTIRILDPATRKLLTTCVDSSASDATPKRARAHAHQRTERIREPPGRSERTAKAPAPTTAAAGPGT